ncbi:hypothetical protein LJC52_04685 [Bacteroidales bacterium OttesenSCG-928-A17]|nr:hypothetical protein [Bacteroidales bacterium OttesenSCG-928-A17]
MNLLDKIKFLFSINWYCTLRINALLEFKTAIKLPIIAFGRFSTHSLKGKIIIDQEEISFGKITLGTAGVGIFDKKSATILNIKGVLIFKGRANIGRGSAISIDESSKLILGNNFMITAQSSIICAGNKDIQFGNDNLLSWKISVMNADSHNIYLKGSNRLVNEAKDIVIGDRVWIGCNSLILKGSVIPDDSIIAANSTISSELKDVNCIYTGMPVSVLRKNIYWEE